MNRYLLALFVFTATIGASAAWGQQKFQDSPLPDFRIYQGEGLVRATDGVVRLRRAPFLIRFFGRGELPSVFASSAPEVLTQIEQVKSPILSFTGTGMAAHPFSLLVSDEPLEIFADGWSPTFSARYGKLFSAESVQLYRSLRSGLPTEPTLLVSGRNYSNFRPLYDGSSMYIVFMLNDRGIEQASYKRLYLVLFSDANDLGDPRKVQFVLLRYVPLIIEFTE